MSNLLYSVNVNYMVGRGIGYVDAFEESVPNPPLHPLPKPLEPKPIVILKIETNLEPPKIDPPKSKSEFEPPEVDTKDEDAKKINNESSIGASSRGVESDSEIDLIDEDGVEDYKGIEGEEKVSNEEELESNPPQEHSIGSIFKDNHGKWMEKCIVHRQVSMEVEHLIDVNKELRNYVRPGGPYKLTRHAVVGKDVPVCADYADWYADPELCYVKDNEIKGYRKRRIQRWLGEVLPIHKNERFDRYLVRCHAEALKELNTMNKEYEEYRKMFPHIVDKWVAILHLGMLFKRKNMGKSGDINESELILKLLREQCEMLYFKTKIIFFEEYDERRDYNVVPKEHWILRPRDLCGHGPI